MTDTAQPKDVIEEFSSRGLTLATAESCTGGMVGASLTEVPGSTKVVIGGIIAYANSAKRNLLGVSRDTHKAHGAVSEETATEMAEGGLRALYADLAVGITGVAGPGGSATRPEGRVCFAVARQGFPTQSETQDFGAIGRTAVREASRDRALEMLKTAAELRP